MLALDQIKEQYPPSLRQFEKRILREYLQYKILEIIFDSKSKISAKLSFLGGTALRIIYGNQRFSDDLDFDNFGLTKLEFQNLAKSIKVGLELQGIKTQTDVSFKGAYRCNLRFPEILHFLGFLLIPVKKY